jgi:hypothetical protein
VRGIDRLAYVLVGAFYGTAAVWCGALAVFVLLRLLAH